MKTIHPKNRSKEAYLDFVAVKKDFDRYFNEMPDSYVSVLTSFCATHGGNKKSNPLMQMIEIVCDAKEVLNWK